MIIGLTGESGAGKSTVAGLLDILGFYIVDCDAISRTLDTDNNYISDIQNAFGSDVICFCGSRKRVDRKRLGEKIFGKDAAENAVAKLNAISHPIIINKVKQEIDKAKVTGLSAVIDAPLLFESGLDELCDSTVAVIAPETVRIARLCERDNIDADFARKRFAAQKDDSFLREHCDHIIVNDADCDVLAERVRMVVEKLLKGNCK